MDPFQKKMKAYVARKGRSGARRPKPVAKLAFARTPAVFVPTRGGATYARPMALGERKNVDTQLSNFIVAATSTGTLTTLNAMLAGGQPTQRIGRRIELSSLYLRGQVRLASTTAGAASVRVLVIYDRQTNKAAPAITDVLVSDNINAQMLLANSHRFKVLKDCLYPVLGTSGPQALVVDEWIPLKGLQTEYVDGSGAGTVADITSGGLFIITYQDGGLITANPSSTLNCRLRFRDQ